MALDQYNHIESLRKLFIGGLKEGMTDEDLRGHFEEFGPLSEVDVVKDDQKKSRRFAFVTFATLQGIEDCLKSKKHTVKGEEIDVRRSVPKDLLHEMKEAQAGGDLKVYMKFNAKDIQDVEEDHIKDYFENMPLIGNRPVKVEFILNKETKQKTGSAFVKFEEDDDVTKAATVKEFEWKGCSKITCGVAKPKLRRGMGGDYGGRGGPPMRGGRGRGRGRGSGGGYGGGRNRGYGNGWGNGQGSYSSGYDNGYGGGYEDYAYGGYGYDDGYYGGYDNGYGNQGYGNYGGRQRQGGGGRYRPY